MPSFDIVSKIDKHELTNAVDQANRELGNRFDFKGSDARFEMADPVITQFAPSEFQLKQMLDILRARLIARGIDAKCLDLADPDHRTEAHHRIDTWCGLAPAAEASGIHRTPLAN